MEILTLVPRRNPIRKGISIMITKLLSVGLSTRSLSAKALIVAMALMPLGNALAGAPQHARSSRTTSKAAKPAGIYNQGYTKGYGEGYGQGQRDWHNSSARDFQRSESFQNRQQRFDPRLGSLEEYRSGYDLGFELGYTDAYYGRAKNINIPPNAVLLAKAAALSDMQRAEAQRAEAQRAEAQRTQSQDTRDQRRTDDQDVNRDRGRENDRGRDSDRTRDNDRTRDYDRDRDNGRPRNAGPINVPSSADFKIRLTSRIDTKKNVAGDRFTAVVLTPSSFENATIEGHIATLNRSGKVSGKTELGIAFDSITLEDGRTAPFHGDLQRIYDSENVKKVDEEGHVETGNKTTDTQKRGAIGAVAGAVLGGIAGGGKGALLGAIIGGAAGVGTVLIEGNKDLVLEPGTEMLVRTEGSKR